MKDKTKVNVEKLKSCCDLDELNFETTKELEELNDIIGQDRAKEALDIGLDINKKGFNVYVAGTWGSGRSTFVKRVTEKIASKQAPPDDYIYGSDFEDSHNSVVIKVENGKGKKFIEQIYETIAFLRKEIEDYFVSKEYENAKKEIYVKYKNKTKEILEELNEIGSVYDFKFKQTEKGIVSIPLMDDEPMSEEEYNSLSDEEYLEMKEKSEKLQVETADYFNKIRSLEKEYRENIKELNKSMGRRIVSFNLMELRNEYTDNKSVIKYLDSLEEDIVEHISKFINDNNKKSQDNPLMMFKGQDSEKFFDRYKLNLFVDNSELDSAPVIFETNPTYQNLIGTIEYTVEMGVKKTDFRHIKNGALHRANGGYLIVLAKDILANPFAWKGLKRAMLDEKVTIESMHSTYSAFSASTIKPEPIDMDLKVIVIGEPRIYHLLSAYDEEFGKLFKIRAEFDYETDRSKENVLKFSKFIGSYCRDNKLRHLTKDGVGKIIDYSTRLVSDKNKLSARLKSITEILVEANSISKKDGLDFINKESIEKTIKRKEYRDNRYEEKILELFDEGTYLINVSGKKVGEINGLAVISTGQYSFGKPNKITVSTFKGKKGIVNIEREVRSSGKIHDKGVLILSGYLGHKFAKDKTLAFTASVVFEQLYGGIEGDSASSTELYAILSSLANVPINQSIAVTGSVNQRGEIQPIGGINEKIEGFYKICKMKGLNGEQGVMMPVQNVKNLVLKDEVIEAVKDGKFHIYAIEHIDQGIEILTGKKAGKKDEDGNFPEGSINYLVNERLVELSKNGDDEEEENGDKEDKNK
ncbi:MAG: Lon protease family protein [Bacillota bacterium]